jgi:hypothetical protein
VSEDIPNEQFLPIEMNRRYESVFVAANVENVEGFPTRAHVVHCSKRLFQLSEISKIASNCRLEPCIERYNGLRMSLTELDERFP